MTNFSKNRRIAEPKEEHFDKAFDDVYRRLIVGQSGKVNISYHFKRKNAPAMKVLELNTPITKQLSAYLLIQKDINDVLSFIEEFSNIKNLPNQPTIAKSLDRSIVITYAKCFVSASKGRGTVLDPAKVFNNKDDKDIHDEIMKMRHQYVAHAGDSKYENSRFILCFPPNKKTKKGLNIYTPVAFSDLYNATSAPNTEIIKEYKSIANIVYKHVEDKISTLRKKTSDMLSKIPPHEYQQFLDSNNLGW